MIATTARVLDQNGYEITGGINIPHGACSEAEQIAQQCADHLGERVEVEERFWCYAKMDYVVVESYWISPTPEID